jgi:hypothetical protein
MKLMKSDVIRINDGDYMRELSKRIQKNYEVFFFIFVIIFTKYEKLALE